MRSVPVRNGRPCIFRVARVGGTIRKVEEEAIRQARALILATKSYMAGNKSSAFELLTRPTTGQGKGAGGKASRRRDFVADIMSDDDDEDGVDNNDDGNDDDDDDDDDSMDDDDGGMGMDRDED